MAAHTGQDPESYFQLAQELVYPQWDFVLVFLLTANPMLYHSLFWEALSVLKHFAMQDGKLQFDEIKSKAHLGPQN